MTPGFRRETLFDGDDVIAYSIEADAPAERVIVSFAPYARPVFGAQPAEQAGGFGRGAFVKRGFDEIHVVARRNHWYQTDEMEHLLEQVRRRIGGRKAITYGGSMGGYAAIAFAGRLGARFLALSPQYTIDPRLMPQETRWPQEAAEIAFSDDYLPDGSADGVFLYDPFSVEDAIQAKPLKHLYPEAGIVVPFASHAVPAVLQKAIGLPLLVSMFADGTLRPSFVQKQRRKARRGDATVLANAVFGALMADRPRLAATPEQALFALPGLGHGDYVRVAEAHARKGEAERACEIAAWGLKLPRLTMVDYVDATKLARIARDQAVYLSLVAEVEERDDAASSNEGIDKARLLVMMEVLFPVSVELPETEPTERPAPMASTSSVDEAASFRERQVCSSPSLLADRLERGALVEADAQLEPGVLFDGRDVVARGALSATNERVVVTFAPWSPRPLGAGRAKSAAAFGAGVFVKRGFDEIHIVARANHWYQTAEMEPLMAAVRAAIGGRPAIAYGTSMGGFGAITFGPRIGARFFALAPQYSIDRRLVPDEKRWASEFAAIDFRPNYVADGSGEGVFFYDPLNIADGRQAAPLVKLYPRSGIRCPFAGHAIPAHLNVIGLGDLVASFAEEKFDAAAFHVSRRAIRRSDPVYLGFGFDRVHGAGHIALAARLETALLALPKPSVRERMRLYVAYHRARDSAKAREVVTNAMALPDRQGLDYILLARMLRGIEDHDGFAELVAEASARALDPVLIRRIEATFNGDTQSPDAGAAD